MLWAVYRREKEQARWMGMVVPVVEEEEGFSSSLKQNT